MLTNDDPHISKLHYCPLFCEENVYNMVVHFVNCINESGIAPLPLPPLSYFYIAFISSESKQTPLWNQRACITTRPVLWDYHVILISKALPSYVQDVILLVKDDTIVGKVEDCLADSNNIVSVAMVGANSDALEEECTSTYVYDQDSNLPFPTEGREYCRLSMRPEISLPEQHEQLFRVIPAQNFIDNFASDRSVFSALLDYKIRFSQVEKMHNFIFISVPMSSVCLTTTSILQSRSHMANSGAPYPDWPCIRSRLARSSMNLHEYTTIVKEESGASENENLLNFEKGSGDRYLWFSHL